jgi:hypothetical protein
MLQEFGFLVAIRLFVLLQVARGCGGFKRASHFSRGGTRDKPRGLKQFLAPPRALAHGQKNGACSTFFCPAKRAPVFFHETTGAAKKSADPART